MILTFRTDCIGEDILQNIRRRPDIKIGMKETGSIMIIIFNAMPGNVLAFYADAVLLACTEIPAAFAGHRLPARVIDGTEALARACITWGLSRRT